MDKVSTEDKNWWIEWGVEKESQFLQRCTEEGLLAGIQKSSGPAYYPEFIYQGQYLDLKTVQTPFFLAKRLMRSMNSASVMASLSNKA